MYTYEICAILSVQLDENGVTETVDKIKGQLTEGGATVKDVAMWGRRRLAYPINKQNYGFFVVYYFDLEKDGGLLAKVEQSCRYDENVMRTLTIKVPTKKRGNDIKQFVPQPGYLADFNMELAPAAARRHRERQARRDSASQRYGSPHRPVAPRPPASAAPSEAPAPEAAKEETPKAKAPAEAPAPEAAKEETPKAKAPAEATAPEAAKEETPKAKAPAAATAPESTES